MKKLKYIFILSFVLFIPKVYAFTYDIGTEAVSTSNSDKTLYNIRVSLKNISGSEYGIASCTLGIKFNNVKLDSAVRTLGSWTVTTGKFYLFDTGSGVSNDSEFFIIPVKVDGEGSVELTDIECFDDQTSVKINNKKINLKVNEANSTNGSGSNLNNNNTGNSVDVKDSNCDLSDIKLSEGTIEFESGVTEYYLNVSSLDDLVIEPVLISNKASFDIRKENGKAIIIVTAEDGTEKTYTLFVEDNDSKNIVDERNTENNYVPIFIGIICVLVLINVFRIIKSRKK